MTASPTSAPPDPGFRRYEFHGYDGYTAVGDNNKERAEAQPTRLDDPLPEVWATFADGREKMLFTYYPDEIAFGDGELLGLTEAEANQLKGRKDRAYLRA